MSTAQIKARYFKPLVVSCALHSILLFPFFLMSKLGSYELNTISVSLSDAKSKVETKPETLKKKINQTKNSPFNTAPVRRILSEPDRSPTDSPIGHSTSQTTHSPSLARKASVVEIHKPLFVARALSKGIEGIVVLDVKVGKNGEVTKAKVRNSLGYGLDEESLSAIYKFKFEPARDADGNPIDDELIYYFKFEINDSSG